MTCGNTIRRAASGSGGKVRATLTKAEYINSIFHLLETSQGHVEERRSGNLTMSYITSGSLAGRAMAPRRPTEMATWRTCGHIYRIHDEDGVRAGQSHC